VLLGEFKKSGYIRRIAVKHNDYVLDIFLRGVGGDYSIFDVLWKILLLWQPRKGLARVGFVGPGSKQAGIDILVDIRGVPIVF
jgi:hypothetical protein